MFVNFLKIRNSITNFFKERAMQNDSSLTQEIEKIRNTVKNKIQFHNRVIGICTDHLSDLQKSVAKTGFESEEAEILFFKETKQEALHNLVCHSEIKSFEIKFPKANKEVQKRYINKRLLKINEFFKSNLEFTRYIEEGLTHFDSFYFTRKHNIDFQIGTVISYYRVPEFSTSHDLLLATLNANKKLIVYLKNRIQELSKPVFQQMSKSELKWTSSKTALTELTYALYHGGAVNNGNTDIIEIAQALQNTFNFPMGDVYRTYLELRSRKKGRTKFLDELSNSLISGMDKLDN